MFTFIQHITQLEQSQKNNVNAYFKGRKEPVLMRQYDRYPHLIQNWIAVSCRRWFLISWTCYGNKCCEYSIKAILEFPEMKGNCYFCSEAASVQSAKLQSNATLCAYTRSSITIQNTDDQDDFYGWILGWINLIFSGLAFIAKQIFWEFCQQIKNVSNATNAIWNHFISHWYRYIQCNLVIWKES